jgi:hypothetical protein
MNNPLRILQTLDSGVWGLGATRAAPTQPGRKVRIQRAAMMGVETLTHRRQIEGLILKYRCITVSPYENHGDLG